MMTGTGAESPIRRSGFVGPGITFTERLRDQRSMGEA